MRVKDGVVLSGIDASMIPVLFVADELWRFLGRAEGVTVTSGLEGEHSSESLHYVGRALDFRTRYFDEWEVNILADFLRERLPFSYDVVVEPTHIHVEYDPKED